MSGSVPRLYLVDGSSYVYRAFFALPPLTNPDGLPTNAVYGVTTMLLKLVAAVRPEYLAVVFDAPGPTFRDDIFAEYKANRAPTPPDLIEQFEFVSPVVEALGIAAIAEPGVEADDVIATLAERLASRDMECVVVTGDKDFMQIVGPRVSLWDTMRDRWTDEAAVVERLGVKPDQVVDVMALMGDSVDNVPGIKGIGQKSAVALVQEFGSLEGILSQLPAVEQLKLRGAKKVAGLLRTGEEMARLSRDLVTLRRDVPLHHDLDDLRVRERDLDKLRELFSRLGFHSLMNQLLAEAPALTVSTEVLRDPSRLQGCIAQAREDGWLAMATICEAGPVATTPAKEVVLCGSDATPLRVPMGEVSLRRELGACLEAPEFEILGHDLKRDVLSLAACGVEVGGVGFDAMIASYLLEATPSHGFGEIASDVLGSHVEGFREEADATAAGVVLLPRLRAVFGRQLEDLNLAPLFHDVEMPLTHVLARMERRGVLLDVDGFDTLRQEFSERMDVLMREAYELAGGEFNINSPPQLREVLFEKLGLPTKGVRRGKTGYSTDVDVLTRLAAKHPLPEKILEYRTLAKLKSTYIDALPAAINPTTGRLHTTFNQTVAATGRLSSSDPNLQNVPVRGEQGRRIREAFVAPPGSVLVAADYSQIELRVLAHLSQDRALLEAFRNDQDVHARTAAEVFGVLPGTVTADMRRTAKVINFGIIYGMGPQRLAHELDISVAEAQRYIGSYFERHAGVREYMKGVADEGRERGYVETILGRRRAVRELSSGDRGAAQAAERAAANTPIQGSAADIIKVAMVAVEHRLVREEHPAALILQVHDELLLEVAEGHQEAVARVVREEMESAMPLTVPLRVDVAWGQSWSEAH